MPSETAYSITVPIARLEEKFDRVDWVKSEDGQATYTNISLGWYVQFEGSTESIFLSEDKPTWQIGDMVKITFRRTSK